MFRIDSHQHFWQLSRGDYDWLTPELKVLYRDFLPNDLLPLLKQSHVNNTVLVQAAATVEETQFMLEVAENNEFVVGVVGWVDLESDSVIAQLDTFNNHSLFKGIRPMLQDIDDVNWVLKDEFAPIFEYLIAEGLTFDALVLPEHLDALYILLKRYPDLKVVIDHGGKPPIEKGTAEHWCEKIALIATQTSAYCKLSGLVTEAGDSPHFEQLSPYMEHLLACFGAERLMWGSDWPVVNLSSSYQEWQKHVDDFISPLSKNKQKSILAGNAQNFYQL